MREIIRLGLILLLICAIAAVSLGLTYELTIDQITAQRKAINEQARKEVLSDAMEFKPVEGEKLQEVVSKNDEILEIYGGYKDNNLIGYAIKAAPQGYGGPVEVITGINMDGVITGVRIGNHLETPGLGANATNPSFYKQYDNKTVSMKLKVVKANPNEDEIQALSGATITSTAVTNAVNYSIDAFKSLTGK
jgi:electron transport complex protein RnfG